MIFLMIIIGIVFLFGLVQWARSGSALLEIHKLTKHGNALPVTGAGGNEAAGLEAVQKSIQSMEMTTDGLLKSSFKILGVLAICLWAFVTFSLVADSIGFSWQDRFGFSDNRTVGVVGNPMIRATGSGTGFNFGGATRGGGGGGGQARTRNETLRFMGSGLRR